MTRRDKLLRRFDKAREFRHEALTRRFDAATADAVLNEAREQYDSLIDGIPYAGRDRDSMADSIIMTTELLAFVLVLRRRGAHRAAIGTLIPDLVKIPFQWVPAWLANSVLRVLRPLMLWKMRRDARGSLKRRHPDEFHWEVVDDEASDLGINIRSCAVCKTFSRHDAMDFVPYMCALDDELSRIFGLGLRRTGTIALGASHCDFRFQLGAEPRTLASQYDVPGLTPK
ncbi:MAG: L-2-amino-thiazoline-4-carboxylic acid hydrolase [bacterium]